LNLLAGSPLKDIFQAHFANAHSESKPFWLSIAHIAVSHFSQHYYVCFLHYDADSQAKRGRCIILHTPQFDARFAAVLPLKGRLAFKLVFTHLAIRLKPGGLFMYAAQRQ
jgi:hypothetical protein